GRTVTVATAAALAGVTPAGAGALLVRLRRAHLLQRGVVADEYRFHDLLRIYAAERCAATDDAATRLAAERALVEHYVAHVKGVHSHLDPNAAQREVFPDRLTALAWFDGESHNLLPVLELAARNGWHEQVRDAGEAAFRYFDLRRPPEWIPVDLLALASARALGDLAGQGKILNGLGSAHHRLRRFEEALVHFQAALALFRELGSLRDQAHSLNNVAATYAITGRFPEAVRHVEQSAEAYRATGDVDGEARCLANLGKAHNDRKDSTRAIGFYRRALELRRQVGDRAGEGDCLNGLGVACDDLGRLDEAERHYLAALDVYRSVGNRHGEGQVLGNLGGTLRRAGRFEEALRFHEQDLLICREIGDAHGEGISLYSLGMVHWSLNRVEDAVDHLRRAAEQLDRVNDPALADAARDALHELEGRRGWFRGWRTGRR
ncbi:MAG: tetratricopeptide repeat protein, partial [Saccharothrix sp.]|nr:tetratricopeptide repeat protein [Saccharothrix sp.]